ncbi:MAG TPA: tetratricopeptide repeat protein [Thermoanaerobaculia bacterium]|nr:tetratricopeptide repeat protein [Thermoanaerobaculia bacterium]
MKRDEIFEALVDSDIAPAVPREEFGRTLPFVRTRVPLEDIYRLSVEAEKPAELVLKAARSGPDELAAAMRALDGKPYRGFALLYAAQKGTALLGIDAKRALALAKAVEEEASSLVAANREARATTPSPRQAVQAEAHLLESQALLIMGDPTAARTAVDSARPLFVEAGDLGFGAALCDYFEGEAATFGRDYAAAEELIRSALKTFEEFGQDHFLARSEAAIGNILATQGSQVEALEYFERAVMHFDPDKDARALTMTLNNRATSLAQIGRFDDARATYAKALTLALRNDFVTHLRYIRTGLAELDFLRGQYARALRAFREIAAESATNGSATDVLFSRLYVAECLGRTGQFDAMAAEIEALRHDRRQTVFSPSPALGELFVCLDQGTIDADLVAHVREYMQDEENGVERAYQPLRLVG